MAEIIIISLLALILLVEAVGLMVHLKVVPIKARAEPETVTGLPIFKKEARVQHNKTFHEKWEDKKIDV